MKKKKYIYVEYRREEGCRLNQGRNLWCGDAHQEAEKKSGCDKADFKSVLVLLLVFKCEGNSTLKWVGGGEVDQ